MNRVKEVREARNLTQSELADRVGCTEQTIYNIERDGNTSVKLAKRLARTLKSTVEKLFPDDEPPKKIISVEHTSSA